MRHIIFYLQILPFSSNTPMYLGGLITKAPISLNGTIISLEAFNAIMNHVTGFNGCIHGLTIGNHKINFIEDSIMSSNVRRCEVE